MRFYTGYILLIICTIGIILMAASFILYLINKKSYDDIIEKYKSSNFELPMPYSFQAMMGFFGAYPVCRFLLNLQRRKKISFLQEHSSAYNFFEKENIELPEWMKYFCFLWLSAVSLVGFSCTIAFFISTMDKYLA